MSGSGLSRAAYLDATAVNGTGYYYEVQSINPTGRSVFSSPSTSVKPAADLASSAPPAPAGLKITTSGHHKVALSWTASPGASFYSVWRTTLHADGVGGEYPLRTIVLEDAATGVSYTDNSPTDGRVYRYYVEAISAGGTSDPSAAVTARPLPAPPASAPERSLDIGRR